MKRYGLFLCGLAALVGLGVHSWQLQSRIRGLEKELARRPTLTAIEARIGRRLSRTGRARARVLGGDMQPLLRGQVTASGTPSGDADGWRVWPVREGVYLIVLDEALPKVPTVLVSPRADSHGEASHVVAVRNVHRRGFDVVVGTLDEGKFRPSNSAFDFVVVR